MVTIINQGNVSPLYKSYSGLLVRSIHYESSGLTDIMDFILGLLNTLFTRLSCHNSMCVRGKKKQKLIQINYVIMFGGWSFNMSWHFVRGDYLEIFLDLHFRYWLPWLYLYAANGLMIQSRADSFLHTQ